MKFSFKILRNVSLEMQFCVLGDPLELEFSYSPHTDLLRINSCLPNRNNIHEVIQVHIQMACQKCRVCVHGCCKLVNLSKSQGWFFHNHNALLYYIWEKVKTILAGPILSDQVMLICNNWELEKILMKFYTGKFY
jgi:hypothetical protein